MRSILIISFQLIVLSAIAQIKVDKPIEFNGSDPAQRQVTGLPALIAPDAVVNARSELENTHRSAEPATGSLWQIDLPGIDQAPDAGMQLLVRSPAPSAGPLQVMVNEYGPFDITSGGDGTIEGSAIPQGTLLSIVYDGSGFQLMNGAPRVPRNCPAGMVAVNEQFCMQIERSDALEFWDAIVSCGAQGMRLCSWGEFHAACANGAVLGLQNIPDAWEWTNNTANEDGSVRIAGSGNCQSANTGAPVQPRNFRCCFTR